MSKKRDCNHQAISELDYCVVPRNLIMQDIIITLLCRSISQTRQK